VKLATERRPFLY